MATITEINAECRDLCDADTTSYPASALLTRINHAYETVTGWLLEADGRWQFDDTNYTSFPIGTTTLVAGQKDYTFDVSQLRILSVEVEDANGKWHNLDPIDLEDLKDKGYSLTDYQSTSGVPCEYDVDGGSIVLYPAPASGSVTLSGGLKVRYQRTANIFTSGEVSTGTKTPGFASPWHLILAYMAAIPYCIKYHPERVKAFELKVQQMKKELTDFYSKRDKDEVARMTTHRISHR